MRKHFVFKYEKFMGREGIGLYLNNDLISFTYNTFEVFRMIAMALSNGDTIDYRLTDAFVKESAKREEVY